ncbi:MAG: adenylate/guanylate cyclase domain-containing protein [Microcoleaceae cyanobacterium]
MSISLIPLFLQKFRNKIRRLSLRTVVSVPFVLQMVSIVSLVGYVSFRNGQQAVHDLAFQLRNELTARIDQKLLSSIQIPHAINRLNVNALAEGDIDFVDDIRVNQFLQQVKIASFVNGVYCGEQQTGNFIGVGRTDNQDSFELMIRNQTTNGRMHLYRLDVRADRMYFMEELDTFDPRFRPWYRTARASGQASWSPIYFDFTSHLLTLTASIPAYSQNGKNFLGVCGSDILLSGELRQFLRELDIGESGQAFIIERSGKLVSSSTDEPLTAKIRGNMTRLDASQSQNILVRETIEYLKQYYQSLASIHQPKQLDFLIDGERQFVQILPFKDGRGLDWLIILVLPETEFMAQIHANNRTTLTLCLFAITITVIISLMTAKWISHPILRLSQASYAIAEGNINQTVAPENIKELNILANSFNRMSQQLQESFLALAQTNEELEKRVEERTAELSQEKEKSEQLLLNVLPKAIAEQLKNGERSIASAMEEVTILFADIVGFTPISAKIPPIKLVNLLNQIFSSFDELAEKYGLEKIKTIGDAYMVVGGLPLPKSDHAEAIANMALEMQEVMKQFQSQTVLDEFSEEEKLQIRIGINTGSVVAGVIGIKKFIYDLWGDAVNIASRMESSGEPGQIQVTETTYELLKDQFLFQSRGTISVKGRGKMKTYWLLDRLS